jgi:AcrR family transcriptional regulator
MPQSITAQRREEEKEQRRQSILDAAEAVAERVGFEALTMGAVAKEARLSRSLVYFYYNDKTDLLDAVAYRALGELTNRFRRAATDPLPEGTDCGMTRIYDMGQAYVRFAHQEPTKFEAVARVESKEIDPEDAEHHQAALMRVGGMAIRVMAETIAEGQSDGSIRSALDPHKTAVTLWGFIHGMIQVGSMKDSMLKAQFGFGADEVLDYAFETIGLALKAH